MRAYQRLMEYVRIDTTSDPAKAGQEQPTSERQFDLARKLVEEMEQIGIRGAYVDEKCYVYGWLDATHGYEDVPPMGLIAHMDTSPAASGANVTPVIHRNYDGGDIHLPNGRVIGADMFPDLAKLAGETLITAAGDTLLGADDKAGIAEILTVCEVLLENGIPHGKLCIAFTPDEEVGCGADGFDVDGFGAAFAYTVDGSEAGEIEYETFNAAAAKIVFSGTGVHPGSAKDIMVNACTMAMEFAASLPENEVPEQTEEYEGFFHLTDMAGNVESAWLEYIIRDHDRELFEKRKNLMRTRVEELARVYGEERISLDMKDNYYNMKEIIEENFHLVEHAQQAIGDVGLEPITKPVRGGTDGSRLSYMGLPCPNLGTGGFYFHGPNECISAEGMDRCVEIILRLIELYAQRTDVQAGEEQGESL